MKFFVPSLAMFMFAIASSVMAGPYVGIGIGSASYEVDLTSLGGGNFDDDSTGTKLYGGYNFNKYYAAEAAVYNFADASIGSIETSPGSGTFVSASASVKGVGAYAVGIYPLSKKFSLVGKLGVINWDVDLELNGNTATNDGTDMAYALAGSYAFTKEFLFTAEWESFQTDNPELSMFSLGFKFNFR